MSGYRDRAYAESLREFGTPRHLPRCDGWLLERGIGESGYRDAMGPYPLFDCEDWGALCEDLDGLSGELVSVCVVADPLAEGATESRLRDAFRDLVRPFKTHFVRDLSGPVQPSAHHRRRVRRALELVRAEQCTDPGAHLDEWQALYAALIERHSIGGVAAFSAAAFAAQVWVPGIVAFRARRDDATVGMTLWYVDDERAHYHLGAYTTEGYASSASYALFQVALEHFRSRGVVLAGLGGAPGLADDASSGLARFKEGWSTGARTAYLCGRILDRAAYERLSSARIRSAFFPAYRSLEGAPAA